MAHRLIVGFVVGALTLTLATAIWSLVGRRAATLAGSPKQWPFDRDELRVRMDAVIQQQHDIIGKLADETARERARSFLEYYRHRRAAVS
jgi:hypothetical protein